uniref:Uncharacterized protein n=1 Tax=Tetraselmis sp. GSL018 TaxID=582737 RepID=A0A061RWP4_9CHLO|mmetsp:Transcript_25983/g.61785  ORF Transcript_25983/g.61785 Transcript_25983/m.61785 type:complete len:1037 (+) Transcript_25983:341-3451(+)
MGHGPRLPRLGRFHIHLGHLGEHRNRRRQWPPTAGEGTTPKRGPACGEGRSAPRRDVFRPIHQRLHQHQRLLRERGGAPPRLRHLPPSNPTHHSLPYKWSAGQGGGRGAFLAYPTAALLPFSRFSLPFSSPFPSPLSVPSTPPPSSFRRALFLPKHRPSAAVLARSCPPSSLGLPRCTGGSLLPHALPRADTVAPFYPKMGDDRREPAARAGRAKDARPPAAVNEAERHPSSEISGEISFGSAASGGGGAGAASSLRRGGRGPSRRAEERGSPETSIEFSEGADDEAPGGLARGGSRAAGSARSDPSVSLSGSEASKPAGEPAAAPGTRREPRPGLAAQGRSGSQGFGRSASKGSLPGQGGAEPDELREAMAATDALFGSLQAARVGGSDDGSSDTAGTRSEAEPDDLREAMAATDALFSSLQAARIGGEDDGGSSEGDAARSGSEPYELRDAAAATDALFSSLQVARVGGSDEASEAATESSRRPQEYDTDGSLSRGSSVDRMATLKYWPAGGDMEYQDAPRVPSEGEHSAGRRSSSPDTDRSGGQREVIHGIEDLEDAAAATEALYRQLGARRHSRNASDGTGYGSATSADISNGTSNAFGGIKAVWKVEDAPSAADRSAASDGQRSHVASAGEEPSESPKRGAKDPNLSGAQSPSEDAPESKPTSRSVGTQIGTMNEIGCQVGFNERYSLLFDGCTLPKGAHLEFQHPPTRYVPAPVPGGWVPWGAPPAPPDPAPAAAAAVPAEPQAPRSASDPSSVSEYSMSFEEDTVVASSGAKIRRSVRGYNSVSVASDTVRSVSDSRFVDSQDSAMDPTDSNIEESVPSEPPSSPGGRPEPASGLGPGGQPARGPPSRAEPKPEPEPEPEPDPKQGSRWAPASEKRTGADGAPRAPLSDNAAPQPGPPLWQAAPVPPPPDWGPAHPAPWAAAAGGGPQFGGPPAGAWHGPVAQAAPRPRSDTVAWGLEDIIEDSNSEELFRHQLGALQQRIARARVRHVESVGELSSRAPSARAGGRGYHYATLEETLAFVRENYPYRP